MSDVKIKIVVTHITLRYFRFQDLHKKLGYDNSDFTRDYWDYSDYSRTEDLVLIFSSRV